MLKQAEFAAPLRGAMWAYCALHATRLDNILICLDTHLSWYKMHHQETPTWLPHLKTFGKIAIVVITLKIQAKLDYRGIPGIHLGPAEDHKGDTYQFWNPLIKHNCESCLAVVLQQSYAEFHKMDCSLVVKKIAEIKNKLDEMFNEDGNVIQEDELGNQILPKKIIQEDDDNSFVLVISAMADLNQDDTDTEDEDEFDFEEIPSVSMNKFSGVPCSVHSLATFYNPDPQDEWKNMRGEAAVYVSDNSKHEAALIATTHDGNPEPKSYWEAIYCPDFSNWWGAM
jgi:hypothetical protein